MLYSRQAARLLRPSTRTRRRIWAQISMSVYTHRPHDWGTSMGLAKAPSWLRSRERDHGRYVFWPTIGRRPALRFLTGRHILVAPAKPASTSDAHLSALISTLATVS